MEKQAHYYLGVDVGGTKTHALICDQTGKAIGFGKSGPGNWESVGLDGLFTTLEKSICQAIKMAGINIQQIAGAGFGLAGYDWPSQRAMILNTIKPLGLICPVEIVNDATLGIFAGATQGWGVSAASGTGCNCRGWGKDRKSEGRMVGGYPEWSGEYAGGSDILERAMRAVTFEWNKRGPHTALSTAFLQKTGAKDLSELIEGLYLQKYSIDSSYLMTVFEIAATGDTEAVKVLRWAGKQLGEMACGVIRQLELENENVQVVLIGSIYDGSPIIMQSMLETIIPTAPKVELVRLKAPPVIGGVLLGMEQVIGKEAYQYRSVIMNSTEKLLH